MTKQEIIDALHEADNGLTIGWQVTNGNADLQAPVNAAKQAIRQLINHFDPANPLDDFNYVGSRHHY